MERNYKGFDFIDQTPLPEFNGKGLYFRHRKTGLDVFHIANDDEENLFAFVIRTPNNASTGAAHIMEHSVFCGSEKFPLKEPFINLVNQSINTFLNAMTYPDKTVFPASSLNKTDYFNLMDVYGDAVFFPILAEETFLQEGRRIELDADGKAVLQGVVYNEMKGVYSSFSSVAGDFISRSLQKGSIYEHDSGGDPLAIPNFTYEDFCDFHNKFYRPDNMLLFLYGSIPTEEQLDFVQEKFLDRLESRGFEKKDADGKKSLPDFTQYIPQKISSPISVHEVGPDSGVSGSYVSMNWRLGLAKDLDAVMETIFAMQVLAAHDGSPLSKALLDSELGDGLINDIDSSFYTTSVTFGLSGVAAGAEEKVRALILSELQKIAENGVEQDDIDAAILSAEFANREVTRSSGGPYSLELLQRSSTAWNYGCHPADFLDYRAAFDKIKARLAGDKKYFQKLVRKFFIENEARSFVVVTPSKEYNEKRSEKEKEIAQKLAEKLGTEKITDLQKKFEAYQQKEDSAEAAKCIPHISPKDIEARQPNIVTVRRAVKGSDGSEVQIFENKEATNGIVYVDVAFPIDVLEPAEYFYLSLFSGCLFNTGWHGKDWARCMKESSLCSGDFGSSIYVAPPKELTERTKKIIAEASEYKYIWRDWLLCQIKMPVEKTGEALSMMAEAICHSDFSDEARLRNLTDDYCNSALEAIVPGASRFMNSRVACRTSRTRAVSEILRGLSQVLATKKIAQESSSDLGKRFGALWQKIRDAGAVLHVTADGDSLEKISPLIEKFVMDAKLHSLCTKKEFADETWFALTDIAGLSTESAAQAMCCDTQVGCASLAVAPLGNFSVADRARFAVFNHWLSATGLWQRIRTAGGAYGAWAVIDPTSELFQMYSYRDPQPLRSLKEFWECLKDAEQTGIQAEDAERAITGTYGEIVQPMSPYGRGSIGFKRVLGAVSEEDLTDYIKTVLALEPAEILLPAKKILENRDKQKTAVLVSNKGELPANCWEFNTDDYHADTV